MEIIGGIAILIAAVGLYFLPCIVAGSRHHPSGGGILVLNLFLGWTLIGWVGALAWAASGNYGPSQPQSVTTRCPFCAEEILAAAKICKHCQREVE